MRIEKKEDIYILHQGAYFRGFISTISGFFVLVLSLAFLYILFKDAITDGIQKLLTLFTLFLVIIVLINIFRGKEGIEFET